MTQISRIRDSGRPGEPTRSGAGLTVPDARWRSGLDKVGLDLTGNPNVVVRDVELLASGWHVLRRTTFDYRHSDGRWTTEHRVTYDRGNGATILLYDITRRPVLLTRQFRYPVYVNGHSDGMFVETAEELGVEVGDMEHVFDVWMSPGSVTEHSLLRRPVHARRPHRRRRRPARRGRGHRGCRTSFDQALQQIETGDIADAKTILLLQWAALLGPFRTRQQHA